MPIGSAAATALLGLALVLLGGSLVVAQALEVSKNAGLGHLTLEATQGRLDAFVFADGDLGHEARGAVNEWFTLATALAHPSRPAAEGLHRQTIAGELRRAGQGG